MPYPETKVYFDGSHYIGIPHTTNPYVKRKQAVEEVIEVKPSSAALPPPPSSADDKDEETPLDVEVEEKRPLTPTTEVFSPPPIYTTRKDLFETLYKEYQNEPRSKRKKLIIEGMLPYFKTEKQTEIYVEMQLARKQRNLTCRRVRMVRKANLQDFNYFVTFTYDNAKHTEESFKKKLSNCLAHFANRKGWKYMGVWERSPEKQRLHFHGIFYIPEGTMPEQTVEVEDYNFKSHRRTKTNQNSYFNRNFGRSDFEPIDDKNRMGEAIAYLMKYLEKSGEKIVYSKGLPQYFKCDVLDDDVVTRYGLEDKKLLLFDDFHLIRDGEYIGQVSRENIELMEHIS